MNDRDDFESAISGLVASAGHPPVTVTHEAVASAGATRSTHVVTIDGAHAVVQLRHHSSGLQMTSSTTEVAVVSAAQAAGVPVAAPLASGWVEALQADAIVSRYVAGETIPRRVLRLAPPGSPTAEALTRGCGRALAALHAVTDDAFAHTPELPRHTPTTYLAHLQELLDDLPTAHPALRYGLAVLHDQLPETPRQRLVHGDFRNGNLLVDETGLTAVLDWELAHLGDPMEDLAWLCLRTWRFGNEEHPVGGFGREDLLRTAYENAGGTWDPAAFRWWSAARMIWWGAGLASQSASFVRGESESLVHAASGRRVVELEYDLLTHIGHDHGL